MKNDAFWQQDFGDDYHRRNRVNWRERVPFWQSAMEYTEAQSVLEVGCGPGWNLLAIQSTKPDTILNGVDVNASAVEEARQQGIEAHASNALGIMSLYEPGSIDLVFTAGLLIHVAPEDLEAAMRAIITVSGRYVLAIEYAADEEAEVEYRGYEGKLWRRPFGKLYQQMGLTLLVEVPNVEGFDNCTAWLLEKGTASFRYEPSFDRPAHNGVTSGGGVSGRPKPASRSSPSPASTTDDGMQSTVAQLLATTAAAVTIDSSPPPSFSSGGGGDFAGAGASGDF